MKKGNKVLSLLVLILILSSLMLGCSAVSTSKSKDANSSDSDKSSVNEYKFAIVPAGVHPYFEPMEGAAQKASKEYDIPEVTYQSPQEWEQIKQNEILDGLASKGYTGIAMFPADPVASNKQITKLINNDIPVIAIGASPEEPSDAIFTLSTNVFDAAYDATQNLIKLMDEKGSIVHLTGAVTDPNTQERIDGVKKAVSEFPDIELIQTISDIDAAEPAQKAVSSLLAAKGSEVDGIVATAYVPSKTVAKEFRKNDEKRIHSILIDSDESVFEAIRDGYVDGTMSQNPYGMAYISTYSLKLLADGYTWKEDAPFFIDSGTFLVDKENVDQYDELIEQATQDILSDWEDNFNKPQ